jgi:hypothetical protein
VLVFSPRVVERAAHAAGGLGVLDEGADVGKRRGRFFGTATAAAFPKDLGPPSSADFLSDRRSAFEVKRKTFAQFEACRL